MTNQERRKGGRPRREDGPKMPHHEVDRLLVEGELVVGDDGVERRMWLTQRAIAERFHVAPSLIAEFSKKHRCADRRAELLARPNTGPPQENIEATGEATSAAKVSPEEDSETTHDTEVQPEEDTEATRDTEAQPEEPRRRPGRPRKADAPHIPYEELDRLLVFGEVEVLENGTNTTVYPTYRDLAERYGVVPSVIADYAKSHNVKRRRQQAAARVAFRIEEKLIDLRAEAIAVGEDRLIQMIDAFLLQFEVALKEGRVRTDNPTDVNTMARLKAFIQGGADSRQEVRNVLSLEVLQERYARAMRDQRDVTPAMSGANSARSLVIDVEPVQPNKDSGRELSTPFLGSQSAQFLLSDVVDLVEVARELALTRGVDPDDEALIENRVLRAAERVGARAAAHDSADVGPRGADQEEDEE